MPAGCAAGVPPADTGNSLVDAIVLFLGEIVAMPTMASRRLQSALDASDAFVVLLLLLVMLSLLVGLLWLQRRQTWATLVLRFILFLGVFFVSVAIECRVVLSDTIVDMGHEQLHFFLEFMEARPKLNSAVATVNSVICGLAVMDALATGIRLARWNLTIKAAAAVCARIIVGMATQLPVPAGFKPIAGDWPPYNEDCAGFIWNPSGHVIGLLLSSWELEYRGLHRLATVFHIVNVIQTVRLISLQQHYTVDVITALGVAWYVDRTIERLLINNNDSSRVFGIADTTKTTTKSSSRPQKLEFRIEATGTTATATLLWDKAPQTCKAIVQTLPIRSYCFHGRNSGDEALLLTPQAISHVPQNSSENATTEHLLGDVLFGFEKAGTCYGGAASSGDASEIAWIYGPAAQACFWVPKNDGSCGFRREIASLNRFAKIDGNPMKFYAESAALQHTGRLAIVVTAVGN